MVNHPYRCKWISCGESLPCLFDADEIDKCGQAYCEYMHLNVNVEKN
jgi:hypothetical protein